MSKLLINDPPHMFSPLLAKELGLPDAIFLQQLHYWLINKNMGKVYNGRKWIRNSISEWVEENFIYWSDSTVTRIVGRLKKKDLVLSTDKLNDDPRDRTRWLAIDYEQLAILENAVCQFDNLQFVNLTDSIIGTTKTTTKTTNNSKKQKEEELKEKAKAIFAELLPRYLELFPTKTKHKPSNTRILKSIMTRLRTDEDTDYGRFSEMYMEALEYAGGWQLAQEQTFFDLTWFVDKSKGVENWCKCMKHGRKKERPKSLDAQMLQML